MSQLTERAGDACELCAATDGLRARPVAPHEDADPDHNVLLCGVCAAGLDGGDVDPQHWFCLRDSAWSGVPAVQVTAWRVLHGLDATWAHDLVEQLYLDDETAAWARSGLPDPDALATVDSNGAPLADGDTVTLIKDLDVKGGGFTAKRGTVVKNIRLTDNPEHVEGQVQKQTIVLVTRFLKKA